jgi:hypothetical protein
MKRILKRTRRTRSSHRYQGYIRVYNHEFRIALMDILKADAAELIEMMGMSETMADLARRMTSPETYAVADRLTRSILDEADAEHPMKLTGKDFNTAAEEYYRSSLRERHIREALNFLEQDFTKLDACAALGRGFFREAVAGILEHRSAWEFLTDIRGRLVSEEIDDTDLTRLIHLMILSIHHDIQRNTEDDNA